MASSKSNLQSGSFDQSIYNSQFSVPQKGIKMSKSAYRSTALLQDQRTVLDNTWGKGSNLLTGGFAKGTAPY